MKKLLLIVVLALSFFSLSTHPVSADNDTLPVFCSVTVNGVALASDVGSVSTINASGRQDNRSSYVFRVCGDLSLVQTLPQGVLPVINFNFGNFDFSTGAPQRMELRPDGNCWVGDFSANMDAGGGLTNAVFDVEGTDLTPVCHRVYAKLSPTVVTNNTGWTDAFNMCSTVSTDPAAPVNNDDVTVQFTVPQPFWGALITSPDGLNYNFVYSLTRSGDNRELDKQDINLTGGLIDPMFYRKVNNLQAGNYEAKFTLSSAGGHPSLPVCSKSFSVGTPNNPGGIIDGPGGKQNFEVCDQAGKIDSDERALCQKCFNDDDGIWTAVGCIPYKDTAGLVRAFIILGLGVSGGVVVLMILAGSFLMSTSQGEPQRIEEARSLITSAIVGLFFLIFSVSILQFIGVRILQIPGFG